MKIRAGRWEIFFLIVALCGVAGLLVGLQRTGDPDISQFRWVFTSASISFVAWTCLMFAIWRRSDTQGTRRWIEFAGLIAYAIGVAVVIYEGWKLIG